MRIRWADTDVVSRGQMTLAPGVLPSCFTFSASPESPALDGTLEICDELPGETQRVIRLLGCRVSEGSIYRDPGGSGCTFVVRDFRWKWHMGEPLVGEYNRRDAAGEIVTLTAETEGDTTSIISVQRSARQLAWLALQALYCPGGDAEEPDAGAFPDDYYPHVVWEHTSPAEALHHLCEVCGCVVAPVFTEDEEGNQVLGKVKAWRVGDGAGLLPDQDAHSEATSLYRVDKPATLRFVGGPTIEEQSVELEAVAWDPVALKYKALDGTGDDALPYLPAAGYWYIGCEREVTDQTQREACEKTLFRAYRIPETVTIRKVTYPRPEAARRLRDHLVERGYVVGTTDTGEWGYLDAFCHGTFHTESSDADPELERDDADDRVPVAFSLDREHGVVLFSRPVYSVDSTGYPITADIELTAAWEGETYTREFTVPEGEVGCFDVVRSDAVYEEYRAGSLVNREEAAGAAWLRAQAYARQWSLPAEQATRSYPGFWPIAPDGQVEQVSWRGGESEPPMTVVSRGAVHDHFAARRRQADKDFDLRQVVAERRAGAARAPLGTPESAISYAEETEVYL